MRSGMGQWQTDPQAYSEIRNVAPIGPLLFLTLVGVLCGPQGRVNRGVSKTGDV